MYTIQKGKNTYEVGIISLTSKNQKSIDFGSQLVNVYEVGNSSLTNFQGLIGAVYTVN
jgi:hypothetical protein